MARLRLGRLGSSRLLFWLYLGALPLVGAVPTQASSILWNTDASGDWNDPANWDGGVPGPTDDVTIDRGAADPTVTHASLASVVSSLVNLESLLVSGGSLDTGAFTAGDGSTLTASGSGVHFAASGVTTIDGANLFAEGGALVDLSQATGYETGSESRTFEANGTSSTLDLSGITTLTGSTTPGAALALEPSGNGVIDLSNLTDITGGNGGVHMTARDAGSEVRLLSLESFSSAGFSQITASNGGYIHLPGGETASTALTGVDVLADTGTIAAHEIRALAGSRIRGDGFLDLDYTVVDGGVLAPGVSSTMPGQLYLAGQYEQTASSVFEVDIGGLLDADFDQVSVLGEADLAGELRVHLFGGFDPAVGDSFDVLSATIIVDTGLLVPDTFADSRTWLTQIVSSGRRQYLRLTVGIVPEPATGLLVGLGVGLAALSQRRRSGPGGRRAAGARGALRP